ncbi:adenylate kinase [Neosynechococcus sphagnicola sy1]|uniref:Adenylate kinase n=1 Tax=Neosynechococcus sphagnicola sy1 TaxID=1497020 RepID=A0A098TQE8_9CYAN|nr:adenylate kinase [Neosynechococcus sphagnicola]KGF73053.1 adenylate kinase [Neosynechococcus sphagnicola sy1]
MPRLIFLGAPGAGKGTQSQTLAHWLNIPHISTGDILRQAVAEDTHLGQKAQAYMGRGELVPDQLVVEMIRERLGQPDAHLGWILDGFPRNVTQAAFLEVLLQEINQGCDQVINLAVPDDVLTTRLLGRGRQDDTEAVIRRRLEVYHQQTAPLIHFYSDRNQLVTVNGDQDLEAVTQSLLAVVTSTPQAPI